MLQLQASGLPTWAQVSERRFAHIQRVTSLLRAWGAAMRVPADEANAWIDAGTWHDALRDAPVEELREITGDRSSPDGLLHGPAVAIKLEGKAETGSNLLFRFELEFAGVFRIRNVPQESLNPVVLIECPRLLFPFAREIIATAVRNGGFPPLLLDPVDFVGLYRQKMAQQQPATAPAARS